MTETKTTKPKHIPTCRSCHRSAADDQAHGWYNLTVNAPADRRGRHYVWLGVFCSLRCLAVHIPALRLQNLQTEDAYERTPVV